MHVMRGQMTAEHMIRTPCSSSQASLAVSGLQQYPRRSSKQRVRCKLARQQIQVLLPTLLYCRCIGQLAGFAAAAAALAAATQLSSYKSRLIMSTGCMRILACSSSGMGRYIARMRVLRMISMCVWILAGGAGCVGSSGLEIRPLSMW
jgi:hypothetical protein